MRPRTTHAELREIAILFADSDLSSVREFSRQTGVGEWVANRARCAFAGLIAKRRAARGSEIPVQVKFCAPAVKPAPTRVVVKQTVQKTLSAEPSAVLRRSSDKQRKLISLGAVPQCRECGGVCELYEHCRRCGAPRSAVRLLLPEERKNHAYLLSR